ncbi:MAG: DUF58 domain-containing protein [Synechococcaceae cyanobacterium RL_1_2]|nr:DUF58 domain-containing protein [Synechococcaceae cyanobacterium RL_1_2]
MNPVRYRFFSNIYQTERWLERRITTQGAGLITGILAMGALGLNTNQSLAYQCFAFLVGILIVGVAQGLRFKASLSFQRSLPKFVTAGVGLDYRLTIFNHSNQWQRGLKVVENFVDPRPTYQELLDTPEPGEEKRNRYDRYLGYYRWLWLLRRNLVATTRTVEVPPIPPWGQGEVNIPLYPRSRGRINLTGVTIMRPDPFGLFNGCQHFPQPAAVWVLPHRYDFPRLQLPGGRQYQVGGVTLASSIGESDEFRSLRDYRPGDPLRKIHWKSWAKVDRPIVREDQDEFFVRHALILDTFQPEAYSDKLEEAIAIAASIACNHQTQESLLDLMFVGLEAYCFTAGRGVGHTEQMLQILASVKPCTDQHFSCLDPLIAERSDLLSGCICVLMDWDESRQNLVQQLANLKVPTLVLLVSAEGTTIEDYDLSMVGSLTTKLVVVALDQIEQTLMQLS